MWHRTPMAMGLWLFVLCMSLWLVSVNVAEAQEGGTWVTRSLDITTPTGRQMTEKAIQQLLQPYKKLGYELVRYYKDGRYFRAEIRMWVPDETLGSKAGKAVVETAKKVGKGRTWSFGGGGAMVVYPTKWLKNSADGISCLYDMVTQRIIGCQDAWGATLPKYKLPAGWLPDELKP